jgi:hypothetical protein
MKKTFYRKDAKGAKFFKIFFACFASPAQPDQGGLCGKKVLIPSDEN